MPFLVLQISRWGKKSWLLYHLCCVPVIVLWLFFAVPWIGLQYAIVAFPGHTYLLFIVIPTSLDICGSYLGHRLPVVCKVVGLMV